MITPNAWIYKHIGGMEALQLFLLLLINYGIGAVIPKWTGHNPGETGKARRKSG